jgi:hypothetical protein
MHALLLAFSPLAALRHYSCCFADDHFPAAVPRAFKWKRAVRTSTRFGSVVAAPLTDPTELLNNFYQRTKTYSVPAVVNS